MTGQLTTVAEDLPQLPFSHFALHFREGARGPLVTPPACGTYDAKADPHPLGRRRARSPPPRPSRSSPAPAAAPAPRRPPPFKPGLERRHHQQRRRQLLALQPAPHPQRRRTGVHPLLDQAAAGAASASSPASPSAPTPRSPRPRRAPAPTAAPKSSPAPAARQPPRSAAPWPAPASAPPSPTPPARSTSPAPTTAPALDRRDHRRQGRALRPRHRGHPPGPEGRPRNRRSLHRRHRLRPDPPHHQGHPGPRRATSASTSTAPTSSSTRPAASRTSTAATVLGSAPTSAPTADDRRHGHLALPGRRLRRARLQAQARAQPQGRHQARRHPAFKAVLTYPKARRRQHRRAQVTLPHSEFLDQAHIRTICTRVQFAAGTAPAKNARPARSTATPRRSRRCSTNRSQGPVFLRSSSNPLPDLVVALHSRQDRRQPGRPHRLGQRRRSAPPSKPSPTPRSPSSSWTCRAARRACWSTRPTSAAAPTAPTADFTGHNGKKHVFNPVLKATSCKKGKKAKKK